MSSFISFLKQLPLNQRIYLAEGDYYGDLNPVSDDLFKVRVVGILSSLPGLGQIIGFSRLHDFYKNGLSTSSHIKTAYYIAVGILEITGLGIVALAIRLAAICIALIIKLSRILITTLLLILSAFADIFDSPASQMLYYTATKTIPSAPENTK